MSDPVKVSEILTDLAQSPHIATEAQEAIRRGMAEQWRAVMGWPYEVSDHGRVRRSSPVGRFVKNSWPGRVLAGSTEKKTGYRYVSLRDGKRHVASRIHVLVATAFVGPRPTPKHQVSHQDQVSSNNRPENLKWVLQLEHTYHDGNFGVAHHAAKLNNDRVREARTLHAGGMSCCEIARRFGLNSGTIWNAVHRRTWAHVADRMPF